MGPEKLRGEGGRSKLARGKQRDEGEKDSGGGMRCKQEGRDKM